MGNCLGRSNLMVKPLESDGETMKSREEEERRGGRSLDAGPTSPMAMAMSMRIKVRMTKRQLEELKAQADTRMGSSELGRLILKDCLEGKLSPRTVDVGQGQGRHASWNSGLRRLSLTTIHEDAIGIES